MNLRKFQHHFFGEDRDIQDRLFIINAFVTSIALLCMLIEIIVLGGSYRSILTVSVEILIYMVIGFATIVTDHIRVGAVLHAVMLIFMLLPGIFFFNGGITGAAPIWFLFIYMYVSMILSGKARILFLVCNTLTAAACYCFAFLYPDYVRNNGMLTSYLDSIVALLVIGLSLSFMIQYESRLYTEAKERAESSRQEIESLIASQNQFFSSMSHEIRTPINTIIGLNEMILRENISDEVAEDAANIQSASQMLLHLINDILDMSKFQSGQMQLTPVAYEPGNMLSEIVGMLWLRAKEKQLAFHVNVAPDIPAELRGDEVRIKQILINVLNNAIKYTKEGSVSLYIQCGRREGGILHILYTVTDTGIGIKKENIPYLFTAFKRVDEEKNRHIEGTGLGLSIVKQFVDLMGGEITVNSVYTKGTTFIIDLPQEVITERQIGKLDLEARHNAAHYAKYRKQFEAPDARILVVDDNASNLLVVTKLLRDTKVKIDTASSGAEALQKTLNTAYHVIFMDHLMPEMDGVECRRRIIAQTGGLCRHSKIVALTANAGAENRTLYQEEGFDGYIVKPVAGEVLERELFRLLPSDLVYVTGEGQDILEETISWMQNTQKKLPVMITTESVADLPEQLLERYHIAVIPHMVCTREGVFRDGIEIDTQGLLLYMQSSDKTVITLPPDVQMHEGFFAKQLVKANNIVHVSISGKVMHSGCPAAMEAAKAFDNVQVIDTGHLSSGQGLMVIEACRMVEAGKSAAEITAHLARLSSKVHTSFVVDDLAFLHRSGQVSQKVAELTRSFMVRPILELRKGKMVVGGICFGSREKAWRSYIAGVLRRKTAIDTRIAFVTYVGLSKREMDWIREEIEGHMHFDEIFFQKASPAIAVNCGPGTFGVLVQEKLSFS
ncbi:MAG: DegV family EDD domain-containing protein [Oscillospiraceae bacterium]|nr:DegV family EDD domain-containing protein [Oscillospiraceae bacterium]